jgi:hypothetical protein
MFKLLLLLLLLLYYESKHVGEQKPIKITLFFLVKNYPLTVNIHSYFLRFLCMSYLSVLERARYAVSLTVMFQGFLFLSVAKARSLIIKCHLIAQQQHFYSQCIYLRSNAFNFKYVKLCQQNVFKITLNTTYLNKNKNKINCTV